ncbi:retrovirus-related pol polyprotein from transposon TNT 1-94, partial [Tanacetum coccineum]
QYKFKSTNVDATPAPPGNDGTLLQQQPRGEVMETFATVEAVQIILTGIDDDIYSTVDAYPNMMEMWKVIERSQAATRNRGKAIVNSPQPSYVPESEVVVDDESSSKKNEIDKLMALISMSFKKIYKPTNNNLITLSNTRNTNVDNTPRTNRGTGENVSTQVVQQTRIQCYNSKEFGHVARECQKPKQAKDSAYHKEKMLLCKQEEAGIQLSAEQVDWRDDTDDESEDQELKAHYMYMTKIQEVTPDVADNSGPIFDDEPLEKVHNSNNDYNVFSNERHHPKQLESVNDTYLMEQGDTNITHDSSYMSNNKEEADQDDQMLQKESEVLASLIEQMKIKIDASKQNNKPLESSNKTLREANTFLNTELKSFVKPEYLKKAQSANLRLYDIGCYNDNLALMLSPESDETIRLAQESRSKLSGDDSITRVALVDKVKLGDLEAELIEINSNSEKLQRASSRRKVKLPGKFQDHVMTNLSQSDELSRQNVVDTELENDEVENRGLFDDGVGGVEFNGVFGNVDREIINEVKSTENQSPNSESKGGEINREESNKEIDKENNVEKVSSPVIGKTYASAIQKNTMKLDTRSNKWKLTVYGQFVGCYMSENALRYHLRRMWSKYGFVDVQVDANDGCYFKFKNEEDMEKVIEQGPWIVNHKPLFVH